MADSPRRRIDPRLLIGILVIVASVIGAVSLVMALDRTATAWAAPHDLIAGDVIRLGDLQPRPVRLDLVEGAYLIGDLDADAQLVVLRTVGGGELVPLGAVGDVAAIETAVIVVPVAGALASGLTAGSSADVWSASPDGASGFAPPIVLVPAAVVGRVVEDAGIVAGGTVSVEIVVPRDRVARVLEALADGAVISLVPALPRAPAVASDPGADITAEPTPHPTSDSG